MEKLIAGIFGLVLGFTGIWTGIVALKKRRSLSQWPTTNGRVIERGTHSPSHAMLSASAFRHAPLVRYEYEVGGKRFESISILPRRIQHPRHSTKKWAQRQAESFPDNVVVHYNSDDPGESYLILTSKKALFMVIAVSCLAMVIGLLFLLVYLSPSPAITNAR